MVRTKARKIKIDSFIDTDFFTSYMVYTIGSVKYIIKPHVTYVPKRYKGNFIYNHSYNEYAKTKIKNRPIKPPKVETINVTSNNIRFLFFFLSILYFLSIF